MYMFNVYMYINIYIKIELNTDFSMCNINVYIYICIHMCASKYTHTCVLMYVCLGIIFDIR